MKRKDYNMYRSELRRLLKKINDSFVPNHVYGKDSQIVCDVAALRFVANTLYEDLIHDHEEK